MVEIKTKLHTSRKSLGSVEQKRQGQGDFHDLRNEGKAHNRPGEEEFSRAEPWRLYKVILYSGYSSMLRLFCACDWALFVSFTYLSCPRIPHRKGNLGVYPRSSLFPLKHQCSEQEAIKWFISWNYWGKVLVQLQTKDKFLCHCSATAEFRVMLLNSIERAIPLCFLIAQAQAHSSCILFLKNKTWHLFQN